MNGTIPIILLGCKGFICLGSEFYDGKSNRRQFDVNPFVETRNGKFCFGYNDLALQNFTIMTTKQIVYCSKMN